MGVQCLMQPLRKVGLLAGIADPGDVVGYVTGEHAVDLPERYRRILWVGAGEDDETTL